MVEQSDSNQKNENSTETSSVQESNKYEDPIARAKAMDFSNYTIEDYNKLEDIHEKFECFKQMFQNINKKMAQNLAQQMGAKLKDYICKPQEVTMKDASQMMVGKKKVIVLTGAGLSAASGIPTFRGENGFWKRTYADVGDPTRILTKSFFQENPGANWEWHYDFFELQAQGKPNMGHQAILEFQEYCQDKGKVGPECLLVTQNIDDYHCQMIKKSKKLNNRPADLPLAFTPNVYEIHGNVFYMHCSREEEPHSRDFFPCPKLSEVTDKKNHVPRCTYPGCNAVMKPHCMFFDEMYSEHYYRKDRFFYCEY